MLLGDFLFYCLEQWSQSDSQDCYLTVLPSYVWCAKSSEKEPKVSKPTVISKERVSKQTSSCFIQPFLNYPTSNYQRPEQRKGWGQRKKAVTIKDLEEEEWESEKPLQPLS